MHLARFEHRGEVRWGFAVGDHVTVIPPTGPTLMDVLVLDVDDLAAIERTGTERVALADVRLLAPIPNPPQFIGVGLNYDDHAAEAGLAPPQSPQIFGFLNSAIADPGMPIVLPATSTEVDWEVELGVVIGRPGKRIALERALDHVAGYTIVNDVSARDMQFADGQFTRAKSLDTFKPMGPWITTVDELGAAADLDLGLWVNDVPKQAGNTSGLIFDVPYLVHYLSQEITLQAGSIISTGTPAGVGFSLSPPEFLRSGDIVRVHIAGVGTLTNPVVGPEVVPPSAGATRGASA